MYPAIRTMWSFWSICPLSGLSWHHGWGIVGVVERFRAYGMTYLFLGNDRFRYKRRSVMTLKYNAMTTCPSQWRVPRTGWREHIVPASASFVGLFPGLSEIASNATARSVKGLHGWQRLAYHRSQLCVVSCALSVVRCPFNFHVSSLVSCCLVEPSSFLRSLIDRSCSSNTHRSLIVHVQGITCIILQHSFPWNVDFVVPTPQHVPP